MSIMSAPLKICSFNCRGIKGSVTDLNVLATSFDIICLQETWLLPNDLSLLNTVIPSMSGSGISAVDLSDGILCGRPYGGVAFLCQKALCYNVNYVNSGYDWCYAVTLSDGNSSLTPSRLLICICLVTLIQMLTYIWII